MGTAARTLDVNFRAVGVDAVRSGIRAVKSEAAEAGRAAEGISHGAIFGIAEFSRGLGRLADSGQASTLAMRELTGGVMRLGAALGPGIGLIGIFGLLGGVIYEVFAKAREEMRKTQVEFNDHLIEMTRALSVAQLAGMNGIGTQLFSGDATARALLNGPSKENGDAEALKKLGINAKDDDLGFLARTQGITGLKAAIPGLKAAMDAIGGPFRAGSQEGDKLREAMDLLSQMEAKAKRVSDAANIAIKTTVDQVTMGIKLASEKKDLKELFAHGDASFADLIKGKEFDRESVMKRFLPGQIGDMNKPLVDQLKNQLDVEMLKGRGAATTDERMEALKKYAEILKQIDALTGKSDEFGALGGKGPKGPTIGPTDTQTLIDEFNKNVNEPLARSIRDGLARSIGSAISDAITTGFSTHSIGGAFKAAGRAILAGMGGIFEQMGEVWLQYGVLMTSLGQALWNPLTSGPAAIGIGAALIALGATLGAVAHGGGGHAGAAGGSFSSYTSAAPYAPITVDPRAPNVAGLNPTQPVTNTVFLIGKDDPRAQRELKEMMDRASRRFQ